MIKISFEIECESLDDLERVERAVRFLGADPNVSANEPQPEPEATEAAPVEDAASKRKAAAKKAAETRRRNKERKLAEKPAEQTAPSGEIVDPDSFGIGETSEQPEGITKQQLKDKFRERLSSHGGQDCKAIFDHFGVDHLDKVEPARYPELWAMLNQKEAHA